VAWSVQLVRSLVTASRHVRPGQAAEAQADWQCRRQKHWHSHCWLSANASGSVQESRTSARGSKKHSIYTNSINNSNFTIETSNILEQHSSNFILATSNILETHSSNFTNALRADVNKWINEEVDEITTIKNNYFTFMKNILID
jgi:hypothetical protein